MILIIKFLSAKTFAVTAAIYFFWLAHKFKNLLATHPRTLATHKCVATPGLRTTGLVVKAEDSWPRGPGFKPPLWRPFFRHHSFGSKLGPKIVEKTLTWHCCICCNPANGRVDSEEWSAYKIQLHGIEWIVSWSADWDQSPTKKTKKKNIVF